MPAISEPNETYNDWYCEDLIRAYFNRSLELDEFLQKLDYDRILDQKELYNFLNFLLTERIPHQCYNNSCRAKLYFSNTFEYAKKHLNMTLQTFVNLWTTSCNLEKVKVRSLEIEFYCCKCYETNLVKE